jgi:hypothetical protein
VKFKLLALLVVCTPPLTVAAQSLPLDRPGAPPFVADLSPEHARILTGIRADDRPRLCRQGKVVTGSFSNHCVAHCGDFDQTRVRSVSRNSTSPWRSSATPNNYRRFGVARFVSTTPRQKTSRSALLRVIPFPPRPPFPPITGSQLHPPASPHPALRRDSARHPADCHRYP